MILTKTIKNCLTMLSHMSFLQAKTAGISESVVSPGLRPSDNS
jgi:hypothetical protein